MSADNTIVILHNLDGYRVEHIQGMENLYWWPTGKLAGAQTYNDDLDIWEDVEEYEEREEINPDTLHDYFKRSQFFKTYEEAFNYAIHMQEDIGYVEYGITKLDLSDKTFPIMRFNYDK